MLEPLPTRQRALEIEPFGRSTGRPAERLNPEGSLSGPKPAQHCSSSSTRSLALRRAAAVALAAPLTIPCKAEPIAR